MSQYHELEEYGEIPGYFGEVLNPFGYITFAFEEEKDWIEKAEHGAVASFIFGSAFYAVHAMSGGGASMSMWHGSVGGRPNAFFRAVAIRKWTTDMYVGAARQAMPVVKSTVRAISPYAILAAAGYGVVRGIHEILDGPILGGWNIDLYSSDESRRRRKD